MGKILGILADHFMTCAKLPPPNSALRCSCGQIVYAHQHCPTSVSPPQAFCQALYVVVVGCFRASAIPVAALGGVTLLFYSKGAMSYFVFPKIQRGCGISALLSLFVSKGHCFSEVDVWQE